jgi:hypothetical protein
MLGNKCQQVPTTQLNNVRSESGVSGGDLGLHVVTVRILSTLGTSFVTVSYLIDILPLPQK